MAATDWDIVFRNFTQDGVEGVVSIYSHNECSAIFRLPFGDEYESVLKTMAEHHVICGPVPQKSKKQKDEIELLLDKLSEEQILDLIQRAQQRIAPAAKPKKPRTTK